MKKLILFLGILFLFISPVWADEKGDPCHYSTEGTDFWFGLMQNRNRGPVHYLEITVTSLLGAEITVTYGTNDTPIGTYQVDPNSWITVPIDTTLLEPLGSEVIENKGIHLVSSNPVNVYALNYRTQSSDVAVIYPTESLGKEYFAMCYTPHPTNTTESNSEFLIVASADQTTVKITPSVDTDQKRKANVTFSVSLKKGESYQVQSMNSNISGQGDLTGSYIVSNQPIAFYSGVKSTAVPYTGNSRDYLYEQIPPTNTWGKEFFVVPLKLRARDTYRILAAEDGTIITIEGTNTTKTLNRGEFFEFELANSQACRITSTKRVLLAQFCRSQAADGPSGVGDPFMIILSPITQKINEVTFVAYESNLIRDIFYVNIITLTSEVGNILLDESNISLFFTAFPNSDYSYAQISIPSGIHNIRNITKDGGFLAYVYGFGNNNNTESYGYGVGFNLDVQLEIIGNWTTNTPIICMGEQVKLEVADYFDNYKWEPGGETTPSITVSKEGMYKVTGATTRNCQKSDSVFVAVNVPTIDLGNDTSSCEPGAIVLDAGNGFKKYKWLDGSSSQTFTVLKTGDYSVTGTNEYGCRATDVVHVDVLKPIPGFAPNYSEVIIDHPDITFLNQTEGAINYVWDFGDGATSKETNPTHHYSSLGKYHVVLQAVSEYGCTDTIGSDVKIVALTFYIANAFRPDSEISENRIFLSVLIGVDPKKYKFEIFNRVGSTIFETRNMETGWNGKLPNGTEAESGVYVWVCKYSDLQGFESVKKGTVMLVR